MLYEVPNGTVTGSRDFDLIAAGGPRRVARTCSCKQVMKIEVELDSQGNLVGIDCIEGCYLRKPQQARGSRPYGKTSQFYLGTEPSMYLFCSWCRHRRSWRLFN